MAKDSLQTIFEKNKFDKSIALKSQTWFQQQTTLLARKRVDHKKLFSQEKITSNIVAGKLYMFLYDAKHKDTLPYFDRFPLVFPYQKVEGGFMGLNMHYLPYYYRVQLMTRLMQYASSKTLDENTKMRYSWALIAGVSKFQLAEACIKHYLTDHVRSMFIEIPGDNWHTAMMLPVEKFTVNKTRVWGDSLK